MNQSKRLLFFTILFLSVSNIFSQTTWSSGNFKVLVNKGKITINHDGKKLITIASINFNLTSPKKVIVANQSSDKLTLTLTYPVSAVFYESKNDLTADVDLTISNGAIRLTSDSKWTSSTTLVLEDNGEHFFGILEPLYPDNKKSPDLRGEVVDVEVNGDNTLHHENYASAWSAFYMTNKGYASFFDTFAFGKYKLGINGQTELFHHTGKLDWYIIPGKNGDEILQKYYGIIGRPKSVPMWACGPVAWRDQNDGGAKEILNDIQQMTEFKIPFTAWFVDRPYSNGADAWSKMDFNEKFANPKEWIATINNKYGMQFMTWVGPMTFADKDFPGLLPNFRGYIDLTVPEAVKAFGERMKANQYSLNVRGHKMDRGDEQFPMMSPWSDKTTEAERRNKYIYLYSKTIDGFLKDSFKDDNFNFARAAIHRCQPYLSAIWGGDSRSTWDGMAGNLANAMRSGFIGFPVWGSDVGGYLGGRIPEALYVRWLQFGAWSGMDEIKLDNAGGKGEDRPPWKYSEQLQNIFREYCSLRMEMQPFIFSLANTSYKNGVAMKPLAYVYPNDKNTYNTWDEYLLGKTFLVAPILDSTGTRNVYLPEGKWYNFNDLNKSFVGNKTISVTQPLDKIPVFVKANSIYVTGKMVEGNSSLWSSSEKKENNISIHFFPGNNKESFTFDYIDSNDGNKEKEITVSVLNKEILFSVPALSNDASLIIKLDKQPVSIKLNGQEVKLDWNKNQNLLSVSIVKNQSYNGTITINK
jgi:alpha-glucosidase (family GH31 glycosyl hydrolase)